MITSCPLCGGRLRRHCATKVCDLLTCQRSASRCGWFGTRDGRRSATRPPNAPSA